MIQSVCILGRQPALGLAELESLYGVAAIVPIGSHAAGLMLDVQDVDFARLGGSTRQATVVGEVPGTSWKQVEKGLLAFAKSTAFALPTSGKFHLGLSAYGFDVSPAKLNALGLTLKKVLRARHDGSVRLVPNNETELGTAQVIHHDLVKENGTELLIIAAGDKTYIAKTTSVQDIASYTTRDRERPKRDARVGMLPPKLAQIIINLAAGPAHDGQLTILDPFCGTGVVLQEALLMGYDAYGTDLEPRMIAYTTENLQWLSTTYDLQSTTYNLEASDATTHRWNFPAIHHPTSTINHPPPTIHIACETYLGRPFTERPSSAILAQTVTEVNLILKRFLQNIRPQLAPHARLCLAVPCWFDGREQKHLPLLAQLTGLGFERVGFEHAATPSLIYHREGQIVGRELVTLVAV